MSNSRANKGIKNIIFGGGAQLLILLIGLLLPRIIMVSYGSEVNGLFNSVNQVFSYIALLEAGIGTATIQALYKPLVNGDRNEISSILVETRNYFRRVTRIYFAVVVAVSLIFPFVVESKIPNYEIILVILIHGLSNILTFWFTSTLRQLIVANGESFLVNTISLITTVLTSVSKIILATVSANIIFIQLSHFAINIIHILIYIIIFRKKYKWVDFNVEPKAGALKQRNAFVVHEFSGVIFNSTDTVLLSVFVNLAVTSKYSIYNMIFHSLNVMFSTIHSSVSFVLGHAFVESKEKYLKIHDAYQTYYTSVTFSLISVCYILILPFIKLYTSGVTDIEYYDEKLPILFALIAMLSLSRKTETVLINLSGHAKNTIPNTLIEAGINLALSLVFVNLWGVYGVLLGTVVALLYRSNDMIWYANKKILGRWPIKTYKTVFVNFALFGICCFLSAKLNIVINSYVDFVIWGLLLTAIIVPAFFIVNSLVNMDSFRFLISTLKNKNKEGENI